MHIFTLAASAPCSNPHLLRVRPPWMEEDPILQEQKSVTAVLRAVLPCQRKNLLLVQTFLRVLYCKRCAVYTESVGDGSENMGRNGMHW